MGHTGVRNLGRADFRGGDLVRSQSPAALQGEERRTESGTPGLYRGVSGGDEVGAIRWRLDQCGRDGREDGPAEKHVPVGMSRDGCV